ncbi:hypothetical protein [Hymenobacter sp.]|uniref:hypothetical protein n=1 Tax=Hymenobacter sp. TaxID=1898978 RepID=UPI00286B1D9D|nr:hypothetical protein [Hymenobacter sp.]
MKTAAARAARGGRLRTGPGTAWSAPPPRAHFSFNFLTAFRYAQASKAPLTRYDVVVGASNAGLSAALVLGRAQAGVLVLDGGPARNAPAFHSLCSLTYHDATWVPMTSFFPSAV